MVLTSKGLTRAIREMVTVPHPRKDLLVVSQDALQSPLCFAPVTDYYCDVVLDADRRSSKLLVFSTPLPTPPLECLCVCVGVCVWKLAIMRALMKQEIRYKFAEMLVLRSPEVPSSSSQRRDRLTAHTCAPLG